MEEPTERFDDVVLRAGGGPSVDLGGAGLSRQQAHGHGTKVLPGRPHNVEPERPGIITSRIARSGAVLLHYSQGGRSDTAGPHEVPGVGELGGDEVADALATSATSTCLIPDMVPLPFGLARRER